MPGGYFALSEVIVDPAMRDLCRKPYPNHPHGCPNYSMKIGCPPGVPLIGEMLKLDCSAWAIFNIFDFGAHVARMRAKHPEWSERQVRCCLYWQGTARAQLREVVKQFQKQAFGYYIAWCPEAQGVNVTETMRIHGHFLEWPPETVAYQVVIAGAPRRS